MNMDATATAEPIVATEPSSGNAPATAEPTSATTTDPAKPARIGSMRESFERLEKKQAAAPDAGKTGTATTAQPATGDKAAAATGVPPQTEWPKILDNARAKAKEEGAAQYREKFGWAEKVNPQQLQHIADVVAKANTDPIGYVIQLIRDIEQHPVHGPAWKARNGSAQPSVAAASLDPDVQVVDDKGQPVAKTFSAERVQAIVKHAVDEALGREVQPLKTDLERRQADLKKQETEKLEAQQSEFLNKSADTAFGEICKILEIKNSDPKALTAEDNALISEVSMLMDKGMTGHSAALEVREKKVVPRLKGAATQDAMTEFQRKANGNTANGNGRTAMPKKPTNPRELAAWMRDRDAAATKA